MKLPFPIPTDDRMHRYCVNCHSEAVDPIMIDGLSKYHCRSCGQANGRAIYFDLHQAWLDTNGELWHESVGIMIQNPEGKYLFFERTEFPYALAIPAGHVDRSEVPAAAALRELAEETGIIGYALRLVGETSIEVDSCSAGADTHHWSVYRCQLEVSRVVEMLDEGGNVVWLTVAEALTRDLAPAVRRVLEKFGSKLVML